MGKFQAVGVLTIIKIISIYAYSQYGQ